jgi:hexosaminidase
VSNVYNFPYREFPADELNSRLVLGIQANIWTELVGSPKRLDFMIFPRMAALAEAAWTDSARKDEASFNERLKANLALYDKNNIYYYNPFDPTAHPEAVDFAPKLVVKPEKHSRHGRSRKSKRHHGKSHKTKASSSKSHSKSTKKKKHK